jgi:hypothetical protein
MDIEQRKKECLAKAKKAEEQAAKAPERRIKDGLLKLAAAYRDMANVYSS